MTRTSLPAGADALIELVLGPLPEQDSAAYRAALYAVATNLTFAWSVRFEAMRMWERLEPKDNCKFCRGQKGGVPGNENIIRGVVVCDYCTALLITMGIS